MHPHHRLSLAGLLLLVALLAATDLLIDAAEGAGGLHLAVELAVLLVSGVTAAALLRSWYGIRQRLRAATAELSSAQGEAERWQARYQDRVRGLAAAMQEQFARWGLSPAESEIALLLLKGLSHQEIAALRGTGERTVREQARTLYRKASVSGRSELSAFFLEDLLPPGPPDGSA